MRSGKENFAKRGDWQNAAIGASNLSELELTLGEVAEAVGDAEQSVTYADRSGDAFEREAACGLLADVLHHAGRRDEALKLFREVEAMQAKRTPGYPLSYSLRGFRYCDLLLTAPERVAWQWLLECGDLSPLSAGDLSPSNVGTRANYREPLICDSALPTSRQSGESGDESPHSKTLRAVFQRAAQTLKYYERGNWASLLDIALDHLTLGRAALYAAILEDRARSPLPAAESASHPEAERRTRSDAPYLETARRELDTAVTGLRHAGQRQYLPHALLTRAWLRFLAGARTGSESAQEDLDEAWEIAERGPMKLHMADIHLYRARLFALPIAGSQLPIEKKYPWDRDLDGSPRGPKDDLAAARKLIEQCDYWRRREELEDAEAAAENW